MAAVVDFGEITLALAGRRAVKEGGGRVEGYEWWQARGFNASCELLDASQARADAPGRLVCYIHRRPRGLLRPQRFTPDEAGIAIAREAALRRPVGHEPEDLLYELTVPADSGTRGLVTLHEERPVLIWPVGVQTMATFRIVAWFVPLEGAVVFAERDIDLFWLDAAPPTGSDPEPIPTKGA